MKTKLIISLVALGLVAIVGTVAGLGLAGAFGSGDIPSARAAQPAAAPPDAAVAPDPDFREELKRVRISTRGWKTDFSRHTVPFDEILSGGVPRDGIPSIDNPKFFAPEDASG